MEEDFKKIGLNEEMIKLLLKQGKLDEFRELLHVTDNPNLIAKVLLVYPKEIASREKISIEKVEEILNKDVLAGILEKLNKGKISEGEIKHVLTGIVKGEEMDVSSQNKKDETFSIEEKIRVLIKEKPGLSFNAYMGIVMKEFKGSISGKDAGEIIKKYVR